MAASIGIAELCRILVFLPKLAGPQKKLMKRISILVFIILLASCKPAQETDTFKFDKIMFHTSACFGTCPSYHMEVRKDRTVLLQGDSLRFKRMPNIDNSRVGNFTGTVNETLYNKMLKDLREIGLDTVKFGGPDCCDGAMKTIIVYYNGKRKYLRAMFPPNHANELIGTMHRIYSEGHFERTDQNIKVEYDSIPK